MSSCLLDGRFTAQNRIFALALFGYCTLLQSQLVQAQDSRQGVFVLRGEESGIRFTHDDGGTGKYYVIEPYSAGLAICDYDNDGREDVYFLNGAPLGMEGSTSKVRSNSLFRNAATWQFVETTIPAAIEDTGHGLGVATGDIDSDGFVDIYVSNFGDNVLFLNNGDGTFSDATGISGLDGGDRFSAGVTFFDMDSDGDLDLYCGNYQRFKIQQHRVRTIGDVQFHPGPLDYPPEFDQLFENKGDGTFDDVSRNLRRQIPSTAMGTLAADFDQDGDCDVVVVNDTRPNYLWVNDGNGRFEEHGLLSGLAFDRTGLANGNMGVESRDLDGDGWLDLVTTTYQDEMPVVYQNLGGFFTDATNRYAVDRSLHPHVNWGLGLEDFNTDGHPDLFVGCGHFMANVGEISDKTQLSVRDYLQFGGQRGFGASSEMPSEGPLPPRSARGVAFADLDMDGDIDIVVSNWNQPASILENRLKLEKRSLVLRLIGRKANREGVGATVTVNSGDGIQQAAVHAGRGYQSCYGKLLHFSVDESAASVSVRVDWPGGTTTEYDVALGVLKPSVPVVLFEESSK